MRARPGSPGRTLASCPRWSPRFRVGAGDRERSESAMFHRAVEVIRVLTQNCAMSKIAVNDNVNSGKD